MCMVGKSIKYSDLYEGDSSVFPPRNFIALSFNLGNRFVRWKPSLLSLDGHFHLLLCEQQKENGKEKQRNNTVYFYIYLEEVFVSFRIGHWKILNCILKFFIMHFWQNINRKLYLKFYFMYVSVLSASMTVCHMYNCYLQRPSEGSGFPAIVVKMVKNHHVNSENQTLVLRKTT